MVNFEQTRMPFVLSISTLGASFRCPKTPTDRRWLLSAECDVCVCVLSPAHMAGPFVRIP